MDTNIFDIGLEEFRLPGGPLRFNPADPNLYARFVECEADIHAVEQEMAAKAKILADKNPDNLAQENLRLLRETDKRMKSILNGVFGCGNDLDSLLMGTNLLAVNKSGQRIVSALLDGLKPIMEDGMNRCVNDEVKTAKLNRAQRRAMQ